jgi:hypothetical protein
LIVGFRLLIFDFRLLVFDFDRFIAGVPTFATARQALIWGTANPTSNSMGLWPREAE